MNHSEACRNRIEESMKGTVKGKKRIHEATTRANEFCARAIRRSVDKTERPAGDSHGGGRVARQLHAATAAKPSASDERLDDSAIKEHGETETRS